MKQYKHKKTGIIVEESSYQYLGTCMSIPKEIVENSNDWQEITKPEYTILSYRRKDRGKCIHNEFHKKGFIIRIDGKFPMPETGAIMCTTHPDFWCNESQNCEIYQVRRESDGEVFTVDDKVTYTTIISNIASFETTKFNEIQVNLKDSHSFLLQSIKHAKRPLFTTEDLKDYHNKEDIVQIVSANWDIFPSTITTFLNLYKGYNLKAFSSKEKAEEYILMNKPTLCLKDVIHITNLPNSNEFKVGVLTQTAKNIIAFNKN